MVVLGNPPYSGHSANRSRTESGELTWIGELIEDYKRIDGQPIKERNLKWLQDDYVKFIRFGEWRVSRSGSGILAFITNNGYLDNVTFYGMREHLMQTFTEIYLLDLHGSTDKSDRAPAGTRDENVFDITLGASIGIFVKSGPRDGSARIYHADIWGDRSNKYKWLAEHDLASTDWERLSPTSPDYGFSPIDLRLCSEYRSGWHLRSIFPTNSVGIVTSRDSLVFDVDRGALEQRIADFIDPDQSDDVIRSRYFGTSSNSKSPGDTNAWRMSERRKAVMNDEDWERKVVQCLYRPFDTRWLFYHRETIERGRWESMGHMLKQAKNTLNKSLA